MENEFIFVSVLGNHQKRTDKETVLNVLADMWWSIFPAILCIAGIIPFLLHFNDIQELNYKNIIIG